MEPATPGQNRICHNLAPAVCSRFAPAPRSRSYTGKSTTDLEETVMADADAPADPQTDPVEAVDAMDADVLGAAGTAAQDRTAGEDTESAAHEQDLDLDRLGSADAGADGAG